jgi:ubiquinone/menaquinone biosynthesis C-methylase UbiE
MSIYDQISSIYDWLIISERPYRERALELLDVKPGECILEVGCGTGQALPPLATSVGGNGLVIGLDLSPGMLQQCRNKLEQRRGAGISLLRGTALDLPLEADSCDVVFMSFTLELFDLEAQHKVLKEARRVLKKNGRLGLVTLSTHTSSLSLSLYYSLHEIFTGVIDCRPFDAAPLLTSAGFNVLYQEDQSMFGLPLSMILAANKHYQ